MCWCTGIELDSRLISPHRHPSASRRLPHSGDGPEAISPSGAAHTEVVIVSHAVVGVGQLGADPTARAQVHCAAHGSDLARRYRRLVDGGVEVARHLDLVIRHRRRAAVAQVPVRVVRQVAHGGGAGRRSVLDSHLGWRGQRVRDARGELARVALLAVGRHELEFHHRTRARHEAPRPLIEAALAAVKVVWAIVRRQ